MGYRFFDLNGSGGSAGNLEVVADCSTTDAGYITSDTPFSGGNLNKWHFVAVTWDSAGGAGQQINIYVGNLTAAAAERAYGTTTDCVGSVVSPAGGQFTVGNRASPGSTNVAFQGRIAWASFWNRTLTLAEIQQHQFRPFCNQTNGCVLFAEYGWAGTGTQPDLSGNGSNGTVTGATVANHVPKVRWP